MVLTTHRLSRSQSAELLEEDPNRILLDVRNELSRLGHLSPGKDTSHFYFIKQDEASGELWQTDGTGTGTVLLQTFLGTVLNSPDQSLPGIPGFLAFTVSNPDDSRALLIYSTRENEVYRVQSDTPDGGWPGVAVAKDNRFYFIYTDLEYGREIHYFDFGALPAEPGLVFHDRNENGVWEAEEPTVANQPIRIQQGTFPASTTFSQPDGTYGVSYFPDSTYTFTIAPTRCWETTDGNNTLALTALQTLTAPSFPLRLVPGSDNLTVALTSAPTRCGFTVPFWLKVANNGCTPLTNLRVTLILDEESALANLEIPADQTSDNVLTWFISELPVGASWQNQLQLIMPDESRAGDIVSFLAVAEGTPDSRDFPPADIHYQPTLRCAIDPNDKLVQPARAAEAGANYTQIDETLTYTIRFQNTGNDTAFNVRLEDQLSPDLDLKTFQPLAASHPHRVELSDDGLLQVFFDDILLPDSNVNYVASNGFFSFTIDLDSTALDREVTNTAGIYFDFNAPVITNTVVSTVVEFLDEDQDQFPFWEDCNDTNPGINPDAFDTGGNGIDEDCDGNDWTTAVRNPLPGDIRLFPNPTSGWLELRYSLPATLLVEVFDGCGRRMQSAELRSQGRLDLDGLPAAVYQVKLTDPRTGRFAGRRIIVR
ncbi:MAG: T9SS type A sorting domain-containing protein [Bacteroidota bacterium]